MLIESLELLSAVVGCAILWRATITERFRRFASSLFLLCYVPLFCIYPVLGRWLVGGAISVDVGNGESINDPYAYLVYQGYSAVILAGCLILSAIPLSSLKQKKNIILKSRWSLHCLFAGLCLGIFLYVYSTGLSVVELLIASRFEWFLNDNYSSLLSVIASYLVALTPALVYLAAKNGQRKLLIMTVILLIGYGALSKDRKWLIFIASGLIAAHYVRMRCEINLSSRGIFWVTLFALVLAFWQVVRGTLFTELLTGGTDLAEEVPLMVAKLLTRGDLPYYYNASITAIHLNLNDGFSIPLGLIRRQLFFFLPAEFSLGLKVEDISAIFSDAVNGGDEVRRGNMPPSLIGLLVLSFEWWSGWVFALGMPFALWAMDNLIRRNSGVVQIAVISNLLSATLLLLRGDDSSATYFTIFTILYLLISGYVEKIIRILVDRSGAVYR